MRIILIFCLITTFHFSAFAQIDTSAWEGKTVLMWIKYYSYSSDTVDNEKRLKIPDWNLTDSVTEFTSHFVKRDLNSFGEDTVVLIWTRNWQKVIDYRGCLSVDYRNCLHWTTAERFEVKNPQNQTWETYIFPIYQKDDNHIKKFQELILSSIEQPNYNGKQIILTNQFYSEKVNLLIKKKAESLGLNSRLNFYNYTDYKKNDAVFIYQEQNPSSNHIEVVDLKTNRVIEKIKLEPK